MSGQWAVVIRGDWWLPHFVTMLDAYQGNSEQRSCADDVIAQIRAQMTPGKTVGEEATRPLVVIDPDNREQVERLGRGIWHNGFTASSRLSDALREFANPTPPRPAEPLGLGAVVEDAEGVPWVRCENVDRVPHWYARNKAKTWDNVAAVKVLSAGWSE